MAWRHQQINNGYTLLVVTLFVLLAFGSCIYSAHFVFAQTNQTESKLQAANSAVNQAFNSVLDAEKAGANVTDLLTQLNTAAGILAQAENSNRTGNLSAAEAQAESVLPIAQEVTTAAQEAQQNALVSRQNIFWSTIAFTVIGVFVFVSVLFLFWRWFKRRYVMSLYKANLRCRSNEA